MIKAQVQVTPPFDVEEELRAAEERELVRFVVVGSVDDGKSTLIGRLLYESNALYDDQVAQARKASKQGGDELDFSLFTDGLKAEREQAITIDVAYRYFSTSKRKFIIADTPGHTQYTRNMATGASTADIAIILVDARMGLQTQSRRHAYIARMLGIRRLAVAVNKMDLVNYDQARFDEIRNDLLFFARRLAFDQIDFFPISARGGDNVVTASPRMTWHQGGTILQYLEHVPVHRDVTAEPFRFPVQYVLRPHLDYRGFAGQITSGTIGVGDEVVVLPSGVHTRIKGIDTFEGPLERAFAPMSVALRLSDEVDVSRGDTLSHPTEAPTVATEVEAMLVWLNDKPLRTDRPYLLRHSTRTVPAKIRSLDWRIDLESLDQARASTLALNEIGKVQLSCNRPLVADEYAKSRGTGAFVLIDAVSNATVAAGMILGTQAQVRHLAPDVQRVSTQERAARFGHKAAVVFVARGNDSDTIAVTAVLERALFDEGVHVASSSGAPELAVACAEAGLVAVQAGLGTEDARARTAAVLHVSGVQIVESMADEPVEALAARVRDAVALG